MLSFDDMRKAAFEANDPRLQLLSEINDYSIYTHFIGREVKCREFISSPIRLDDHPSFNMYYAKKPKWDDQILYKDFSGLSGNVFSFVEQWALYNESINLLNIFGTVKYIREKMNLDSGEIVRKVVNPEKLDSKNYLISVYAKYQRQHLEFFHDLGIDLALAQETYFVYGCEFLMNEYQQVIQRFRGTVTFAYIIFDKFKLYQPYEENFIKFFNHCPSDYVQGYQQCKVTGQGELVITKSMKDILVIQSHTEKWVDVIAPHGEGYNISEEWITWYLQYPRIILMYDPDLTGIKGMNKLRKAIYKHPNYRGQEVAIRFIYKGHRILKCGKMHLPVKDCADYRIIYGRDKTRNRLKEILYK